MITASEARSSGPIADYVMLSRALDKAIWQAIYARQSVVDLRKLCVTIGMSWEYAEGSPWFDRLVSELEALGYTVSAEGVASW
jgi:hypothetical protein